MPQKDTIHVLNQRVALQQIAGGFRTSMDSVMLAAACPAKQGQSVLDLGCGVGSVGLCILERVADCTLSGIDIQEDHIEIAKKNAALNGVCDRAEFFTADIRTLEMETFDHVVCNPPYLEDGAHLQSPSQAKARAMGHIERDIGIADWITCAWRHIKGQGSLTLVHAAGQTDDIIHALYGASGGKRFGGVEIIPLWPRAGEPAKRVIIRCWKHRKSPAILHPGIVMHEANGAYTAAADAVLRDVAAIF
jgi:tRNA1(Val) A37 N6-methylase TrmN6